MTTRDISGLMMGSGGKYKNAVGGAYGYTETSGRPTDLFRLQSYTQDLRDVSMSTAPLDDSQSDWRRRSMPMFSLPKLQSAEVTVPCTRTRRDFTRRALCHYSPNCR